MMNKLKKVMLFSCMSLCYHKHTLIANIAIINSNK